MERRLQNIEEQLRSRREAVSHAVAAISGVLSVLPVDLNNVLQAIVDQARFVAGAEYAALGIVVDTATSFNPWVFSGISADDAAKIGRHPRPVGLLGAVPAESQTIRIPDMQQDPRFHGYPHPHPQMHAFLGVPIHYRGRSVGNLYLANKVGAKEFSAEDQWAVELLADHAGVALQVAGIDELRAMVDAERARLRTILESAPHGILFVEHGSGRIIANPAARQLLGRPSATDDKLSNYVGQIRHPSGHTGDLEELMAGFEGRTVRAGERVIVRPDGTSVPVLMSIAPVHDHDHTVTGEVIVFEDITPIRELQEQRAKYILGISHGLRTPLTLVQGQAQLVLRAIERAEVDDWVRRSTETVVQSARRMGIMLLDLVDLTEMEAGRPLSLNRVTIDLPGFLRDLLEGWRGLLDVGRVRIAGESNNIEVIADQNRLERVFINLLSNALRYSPPDAPVIVVLSRGEAEVEVAVSDQGNGISPREMTLLFQPYQRAKLTQDSQDSLGLGLYVTKGLVEANGGRIWAESAEGRGSTFYFTVPMVGG